MTRRHGPLPSSPAPAVLRVLAWCDSAPFLSYGMPLVLTAALVLTFAVESALGRVLGINFYDIAPDLSAKIPVIAALGIGGVALVLPRWAAIRTGAHHGGVLGRVVLMTMIVGGASLIILAGSGSQETAFDIADASDPPITLPAWRSGRERSLIESCMPTPSFLRIQTEARHCSPAGCTAYRFLALERDEVVTHVSSDLPAETTVSLDVHEHGILDETWVPVVSTDMRGGLATTRAPRSGWYRVRLDIPDPTPGWWSYCPTTANPI